MAVCSARIEIPQSVKHIMREQALDLTDEVDRLKHELTESRNAERLVRMQLAEARETKNKKCN